MPLKTWTNGEVVDGPALTDIANAVNILTLTPTAVKTAAYTAAVGDIVPCDATSGGFTVTLPSAPADQSHILVKKLDNSIDAPVAPGNTVTVQRSGSDVFNVASGATTLQLILQDQAVALQYKASGGIWYVTSHGNGIAALDGRYVTLDVAATLTNKTLTDPKINAIKDTNGNKIVELNPVASAVNYLQVENSDAGFGYIALKALGTSPNIYIYVQPKGAGTVIINVTTGQTPTVQADGADANHDLNLVSKGTGVVKANGNPVGVKVAVPSTPTSTGVGGQWAADSTHLYVCTAANTWRRVAIASW